jgi:Family 4 glycosyl hydrolase
MGLKLAVVGGGSTYTPELVDGFARRADRVAIDEIDLLDIDAERLSIVGGLAQRMLARQGWRGRIVQTADRERAIEGADVVLFQLRVGGQQARLGDETLPPPVPGSSTSRTRSASSARPSPMRGTAASAYAMSRSGSSAGSRPGSESTPSGSSSSRSGSTT